MSDIRKPTAREMRIVSASNRARTPSPVDAWVTDRERRIAAEAPVPWGSRPAQSRDLLVLHPEISRQPILGFGAALTEGACYTLRRMPADARNKLMHALFDASRMNFNVCRTCIGSSDCSTAAYTYDDGGVDPDLSRFSIEHDRAYVLPVLRHARRINPDLFLFSSPWSPPGWMKSNGSIMGGCMRHTYMPSYADYFLKFLRAYEAEHVPIQAVTVQNEVDTDQDGTMPACAWPQDYEADFVTMHLGPLLERSQAKTKIWIVDHNFNLWGRVIDELETPDVRKYANAIAWHGYAGDPAWMRRVLRAFPDTEMHLTEIGPNYKDPNYQRDWTKWGRTFTEALRNECRSITAWTLASDERGRPYVGGSPDGIGGVLLIHSATNEITYSGMYWALGHFSRFVRRGATWVESQNTMADLTHCAFKNPDGSLIVVIANPGTARTCDLQLGNKFARLRLAEDSVSTLTIAFSEEVDA